MTIMPPDIDTTVAWLLVILGALLAYGLFIFGTAVAQTLRDMDEHRDGSL